MTATFWTGSSLSFTNGSKTVTVNTGPSLGNVKPNSRLEAGSYNQSVEIESVSGNTITLFNNWPGSTGTTSATITPSAATVAAAGVAAQQVITEIQNLVGSASATATANSFVKRDSNGRVKTATPSANDDAVNKGYLGTAATRNVGTSAGQLMERGAFGLGASKLLGVSEDLNTVVESGFYRLRSGNPNLPPEVADGQMIVSRGADTVLQIASDYLGNVIVFRSSSGATDSGANFTMPWRHIYHSGNTNFNEFGGTGLYSVVALGVGRAEDEVVFYLPVSSRTKPTGISYAGTFNVRAEGQIPTGNNDVTLGGAFFSAISSNKYAVFVASGLSNIEAGKPYKLEAAQATSKITVNF